MTEKTAPSNDEIFYATGWYGETSEGDRAIYTGELALLRATTESMLDAETVSGLREFEALSGNTLYRYRLIEDGPLLPPITVDEVINAGRTE